MASVNVNKSAAVLSVKASKHNLVEYVGHRLTLDLDDSSSLTGRLVSTSPCGNVILTGVERTRVLKRRRSRSGANGFDQASLVKDSGIMGPSRQVTRECYDTVLFVRGSSIVGVRYNSGITSDKTVVEYIGGRESQMQNSVQVANLSPAVPLR